MAKLTRLLDIYDKALTECNKAQWMLKNIRKKTLGD